MANYTSKFTGVEIDNILDKANSGSGIPIVESVNNLDPNALLGTLAVVAKQGNIQEYKISDLPDIDLSKFDPNTGVIDISDCPKVSSISFLIPESPNVTIPTNDVGVLYFVSEDFSIGDDGPIGKIIMVIPEVDIDNNTVTMHVMYQENSTETYKYWFSLVGSDGENIVADQTAIDDFVSYVNGLNGLCYLGNMQYVDEGISTPTDVKQFYDTFIKVIVGVPTETGVYQKNDNWEKLYNTELETIQTELNNTQTELDNILNSKKIIEKSSSYLNMELSPNRYYKCTSTDLSTLRITLGEITDPTIINEYFIEFTVGNNTTVSLPASIKWQNGTAPEFIPNTTYQISIMNNLGIVSKFN